MRILQLSDIHLTKPEQAAHEPDQELRWKLPQAVRTAAKTGTIDLVLVTGDVAFSGSREEYGVASGLLREITAANAVAPEMVFVIPGNHDIDRSKTDSSRQRVLRSGLRDVATLAQQDQLLREISNDAERAVQLMEPLAEYSRFAEQLACPTTAAYPCWHQSLILCGRLELVIHGLNSALASHVHDDQDKEPLIVGTGQTLFEPGDGRVDLALCHHPPDWVTYGNEIQVHLERALIYITGHVHEYAAVGTPGGVWLRAGALQPPREEEHWQPHFSLIDLVAEDDIEVTVHPWPWDPSAREFAPATPKVFRAPLPETPLSPSRRNKVERDQQLRRLTIHLAALPGSEIVNAARKAGIRLTADKDSSPGALAAAAVKDADAADRLHALWEEMTERRHQKMENPFN